jgi:hypothetical protein
MRTTIDLPDDILRRAKIAAVERGSSLRQLVIDALQQELEAPPRPLRRRMTSPPIKLASDSPLRALSPEEIKRLDAEAQALADESRANAVHR